MTQGQKIAIAILIPVALVSCAYAVHTCLEYHNAIQARQEHQRLAEKVKGGRRKVKIRRGDDSPDIPVAPAHGKYPKLYVPREIADLQPEERSELAAEMLNFLTLDKTGAQEKYRAYVTLVNCRDAGGGLLLDALNSDDMRRVYYALKACADLKGLYRLEAEGDVTYLQASLRIPRDAPPDVKMQLARLLGLYRDERAASRLNALASHPNPGVRYFALLSLARVGRPTSLPVIAAALEGDDPAVVAAACRAMSAIAGYDVGGEFTFLPDYSHSLAREAEEWRNWWERNRHALSLTCQTVP